MAGAYEVTACLQDNTLRIGPFTNLPSILRSFGLDPRPVFSDSGLSLAPFRDPDARIPYAAAGRLLAHCSTATRCHHLGLLLGERAGPSHLGIAGFLARSAPDIGTALQNLVDYLDLHDQGGVPLLVTRGHTTLLGYYILQPGVEAADHIYDLSITIACNIMRSLCGSSWNPTRVLLSRPQPLDLAPYRRVFRAPLVFNAEKNALMFPSSWLGHSVPSGDPLLHDHLEKEAKELRVRKSPNLVRELRTLLYQRLAVEKISVIDIARRLGMEERTLNRRLQAEGTSFRRELERIRYSLSQQLLSETVVPVTRVSTMLGYAEVSVFCRAFKRWSGVSPAKWRKQNRRR